MPLKPWYKLVTPREDLREGKPLEGAVTKDITGKQESLGIRVESVAKVWQAA